MFSSSGSIYTYLTYNFFPLKIFLYSDDKFCYLFKVNPISIKKVISLWIFSKKNLNFANICLFLLSYYYGNRMISSLFCSPDTKL